MATDVPVETVYEKSKEYWAETASSVDGMLGGFEKLHSPDITDSRAFIKELQKKVSYSSVTYCFQRLTFRNICLRWIKQSIVGPALDVSRSTC
jgi:hypothetical protein